MTAQDNKFSTTAIAKKLNIPVQQLFSILKDYGWIQRNGDSWGLTPKGEFEGGSFHNSRRFGPYIVWPETLVEHPLLQAIESNQRITASIMSRYYPQLHARQINRALAELGLQQHTIMGWELTEAGRSLGGLQAESSNSGAFYVTWPHEIVDHAVVHRELSYQSDQHLAVSASNASEPDLFAPSADATSVYRGVDGHLFKSPLQAMICNWLYLAQLAHACQRALPIEEHLCADFYVPSGRVYIDCWEANAPADELSRRLRKKELYRELELRHLEIDVSDVEKLDEVLGSGLQSFGIRY